MFAVLLDAITQLRRSGGTEALEAVHWIRDRKDDGLFSFANVCGVLGFEPTFSRAVSWWTIRCWPAACRYVRRAPHVCA